MPASKSTVDSLSMSMYDVVDSTSNTLSTSMVGGGGASVASDGTEGGGAMALEDGGGARPMRLTAFVFTLDCGAPLGPAAFVFILPPFLAAGGAAAGGAAAAAGASKNCFGILFLFDGMVAEIMADTSPAFGGPPTGTSTTAAEGGAPPVKEAESGDMKKGAVNATQDLYEVVHHEVLSVDMSGNIDDWSLINRARAEGRLSSNLKWPNDPGLDVYLQKDNDIPDDKYCQVDENLVFPFAPVMGSATINVNIIVDCSSSSSDHSFDEWKNFLTRINRDENAAESELFSSANDILELRLWASNRGQTLARTDLESAFDMAGLADSHFEYSPEARAQADLKFPYVVTCQNFGLQKGEGKQEAADIALLMQRNEALRIAYIDVVESIKNGKPSTEYYSKLVKPDIHGKDKMSEKQAEALVMLKAAKYVHLLSIELSLRMPGRPRHGLSLPAVHPPVPGSNAVNSYTAKQIGQL
ncbi:hypothetical protein ACQ4PT_056064 [Festuca glaucescens]